VQTIWTIQYLRAVAAIAVLVHHLSFGKGDWFPAGSFGVDIFFVISGLIMWVVTARDDRGARKFLIDRIARIVPTYWCVTLLSAVGAFIRPWIFAVGTPSMAVIAGSLLFIPQNSPPVIPQGWTLNVEMFFYAAFAATIVAPRNVQIAILTVTLGTLAISGAPAWLGEGIAKTYFNPRLLEFVGGLWLGELWLRGAPLNKWLGLGAVVSGAAAAQLATSMPERWLTCTWIAASILIVGGALICERQAKIPKMRLLATVGDASYIIYLIHTPIVQVMKVQQWLPAPVQIGAAVLICVVAAIVALPLERLVVRRTRLWLSRLLDIAPGRLSAQSRPRIVLKGDPH
jgi:exopolysaccharide production protein ExoZ